MPSSYVYKVYKHVSGFSALNETIADRLIHYVFNYYDHKEDYWFHWNVGITSDSKLEKGKNFFKVSCINYLEASHTKKFLLKRKNARDDNPMENGDETIIYVYR
jgi:hypothetical protein